jgi:hypothetical protein
LCDYRDFCGELVFLILRNMNLFNNLINHIVGNIAMWIYYAGEKSIDEVSKKDNSKLGFKIIIILSLFLYLTLK